MLLVVVLLPSPEPSTAAAANGGAAASSSGAFWPRTASRASRWKEGAMGRPAHDASKRPSVRYLPNNGECPVNQTTNTNRLGYSLRSPR
jgi:hypothetical protein